jgi:Uncharacterized conserved protein
MRIEDQINEGIKQGMKAQDKLRLETLRNVKKYIIEAKTAGTGMQELPDADALKIIQKLAKQGQESANIYKEQARTDLYEHEMGQVQILMEFLPQPLDEAALTAALQKIIADCGAASLQDLGKIMGIASKQLAGQADGKAISAKVRELLQA